MRNLVLLFTALILGTTSTMATVTTENKVAESNTYRNNNSFIFIEDGITFSVYPDGEFDFYIDNRIGRNNRNVTFNSGFDYSPFAQYDDYGAVIQVESIPIYYDYNGRVSQIGDVNINYRNGRVRNLGGMNVYYNTNGFYDYHTGYINAYNRRYVWRPFHAFFARPALGFSFVNVNPYRRWYTPIRYTYYNPYRHNQRHAYAKIGKEHRYNKVRHERATVYRNDKRVAVRENRSVRSNRTAVTRRNNISAKNNRTISKRSNSTRNNSTIRRATNTNRKVTNRATTSRTPRTSTATKRTVTRTPQRTTVSRSTTVKRPRSSATSSRTINRSTTVKRPQSRANSSRTVKKAPARSRTSVATRNNTSKRTVSRAPTRSTKTYSKKTSSRNVASRAPSRNTSRSSGSRSSSTRNVRRQ